MSQGERGDRGTVKIDIQAFYRAQVRSGLSASAIAKQIGRHPDTVQKTANGATRPTLATLKAIADVLGVEADSLIQPDDRGRGRR